MLQEKRIRTQFIVIREKPQSVSTCDTAHISSGTCGATRARKDMSVLTVMPVYVKSKKSNKIIETYAFMDNGSQATFCTEKVMRQLDTEGRKIQILLRTMGQEKLSSLRFRSMWFEREHLHRFTLDLHPYGHSGVEREHSSAGRYGKVATPSWNQAATNRCRYWTFDRLQCSQGNGTMGSHSQCG